MPEPIKPDKRPPANRRPPDHGRQRSDVPIYGGEWGDSGATKPLDPTPPDRPAPINTPPEKN